jgi:glycosyltransferase involved in cell wall biosynthesis
MPCKRREAGLERDIEAVHTQEYEDYQVAIVADTEQDPAYGIAKAIAARYPAKAALYTSEPEA